VKAVVPMLAKRQGNCPMGCHTALDTALITAPQARDPVLARKLDAVAGRVL
jgi:5'-methylthioadenosine phosphorylase